MINEQIVNDTIKRMLDSGIDDDTIVSTLKDIGIDETEAKTAVQKVKNPASAVSSSVSSTSTLEQNISQQNKEVDNLRRQVEAQSDSKELHDTTTYNMLNMHEQKIDAMTNKVDEVKQAISSVNLSSGDVIAERLNEISTKLDDVDAGVKSTLDLMKSILEVNRKILVDLEAKK